MSVTDVHKAAEALENLASQSESYTVCEHGRFLHADVPAAIMRIAATLRAALAAETENVAAEWLEGEPSDRALRMQWRARQVKLTDVPAPTEKPTPVQDQCKCGLWFGSVCPVHPTEEPQP